MIVLHRADDLVILRVSDTATCVSLPAERQLLPHLDLASCRV